MNEMGGARELAEMLRQLGRGRDTVLAHITPEEAQMLLDMGGSGTMNPNTGLPEFEIQDFDLGAEIARQQSEDPRVLTEKEQNEEKAKARGLGGISFGGKRYWYDRKTDTIYERNSATSAVGNKLGRFLPEGSKGKIVSDSEYAEAKK